ncbi:hypothetical protein EMIHUDRAFT_236039 [Emiliania huxleyi CCMP1516]|uniref:Lipid A biosynthesis lauroyl acyltransferase n=2 Tax=Emiliania huxleyi TaxID=2903 RepID=A0A0D3JUX2_EMIH1|nr:hypothetical protein EMIHUDRAFT_236039 [Emiliania huxleyi CCMP1516]EOD27307.1 hypothetical protein EMIHUDRAFT_236039 [Emiliania huxleyi CCMP1516]|eukprot:XP_005779736.1 hypothetical protein EMIHUDRAFT_236039 [Emiliania huxleyi CCMP1516]
MPAPSPAPSHRCGNGDRSKHGLPLSSHPKCSRSSHRRLMQRWRALLQDVASYLAVRCLELLARAVPLAAVLPAGRACGWLVARAGGWRTGVVRSNVRSLCSSGEEAAALGRRSLLHLGQAILLTLQPPSRDETLRRALRCDPQCGAALAELVEDARAGGVVVCSAHIGVWELLPRLLAAQLPQCAERLAARRSGDAISERDARSRALPADGQDGAGEAEATVASDEGQGGGGGAEDRLTRRLVGAYADALTRAVRAAPAQYFWWHRRWRGEDEEHGAGV